MQGTPDDFREQMSALDTDWKIIDGSALQRTYVCGDFNGALAFVIGVGAAAELAAHHPDIRIFSYNKVELTLTTHDQDGLTTKDFSLAKEIDKIKH